MNRPSPHRSPGTSLAANGSTWRDPGGRPTTGDGRWGYREKSLILTTALQEFRRLKQAGTAITAGEFCEKFPAYRKSLFRLLDVEQNLGDLGSIPDPFPEPGGEFLGFEIIDEIGRGAIARVFLAAEPELGNRLVVIKVSADGSAEAATLGRLKHPNIVQVYSVKRDPESGMTAVCMPYQGNATLTDILDLEFRNQRPPETARPLIEVARRLADLEALRDEELASSRPDRVLQHGSFVDGVVHLGIQLAHALDYAHTAGVLHLDLKPSNILLTPHGRPMLLDFNLAFDAASQNKPRGGTLPYMAPEQIRASLQSDSDLPLDARCDLFSLGVILYELLTGTLPYGGPPDQLGPEAASLWQLRAHESSFRPIREQNPQVPLAIANAVERCLAIDPADRFPDAPALAKQLQTHFFRGKRVLRWMGHHRWAFRIAALIVLAASIGAGAFVWLRPPYHERQYRVALAAYHAGQVDQAMLLSNRALLEKPEYVPALLLRSACLGSQGRKHESVQELLRVAKLAPTVEVFDQLGKTRHDMGKYKEAFEHFVTASRMRSEDPSLRVKAAISAARVPHLAAEAEQYATQALELDPSFVEAYLIRADLRARENRNTEACEDLETAVQHRPNCWELRLAVSDRLRIIEKDKQEAEREVRRHLTNAVKLGMSRMVLQSSSSYIGFQTKPWAHALLQQAPDKADERSPLFQDLMLIKHPLLEVSR